MEPNTAASEGPAISQMYESNSTTLPSIHKRADASKVMRAPAPAQPTTTTTSTTARAGSASSSSSSSSEGPMTPAEALEAYGNVLTPFEKEEIKQYTKIYFAGQRARKINAAEGKGPNSGYDDDKARYKCVKNDHVAYRYEVVRGLGKGSFGDVVKAYDHKTKTHQALKIIRNEKRFHKQAQVEIRILDLLRKQDKSGKYKVIHMTDWFLFRNHLCITFDLMHCDLYSALKKDGFKGFTLTQCKKFATSILASLRLLRRNRIIHCDLKPENILLQSADGDDIAVIDFGSSCFDHQKVHSYIQSRFYRSPEVILGFGYGMPIDMWSLGCILAELYTGHPIFPGRDEKEQLLYQMEVLGVPPTEVLERSKRAELFFYPDKTPRYLIDRKGNRRLPGTRSLAKAAGTSDASFLNFLQRCLCWDPAQRMTPREALRHEFLTGKPAARLVRSLSDGLATAKMLPLAQTAPTSALTTLSKPATTTAAESATGKTARRASSSSSNTGASPASARPSSSSSSSSVSAQQRRRFSLSSTGAVSGASRKASTSSTGSSASSTMSSDLPPRATRTSSTSFTAVRRAKRHSSAAVVSANAMGPALGKPPLARVAAQ